MHASYGPVFSMGRRACGHTDWGRVGNDEVSAREGSWRSLSTLVAGIDACRAAAVANVSGIGRERGGTKEGGGGLKDGVRVATVRGGRRGGGGDRQW